MNPVYKVYHLGKGKIKDIYVFNGLGKKGNDELSTYFTKEELQKIEKDDVSVTFPSERIYSDDSIDIVKRKVFVATNKSIPTVAMYLFCKQLKPLNDKTEYQELTFNGRRELTVQRFTDYLHNINYGPISKVIKSGGPFDYDDILNLKLSSKNWLVDTPLGQRFRNVLLQPYVVNPFSLKEFDPVISSSITNLVSTADNELVLSTGSMDNSIIYLCDAEEVFDYAESIGITNETTARVYFPRLAQNGIYTLDDLNDAKTRLIKESEDLISKAFEKHDKNIRLLVDVFEGRDVNKYDSVYQGTNYIELRITPQYHFRLPADVVFKVLRSSNIVPIIKFQPGKNVEKLLRLYAPKRSKDGRRIPYVPKAELIKLARSATGTNRVSAFILPEGSNNKFVCEFLTDATIRVRAEFVEILPFSAINEAIKQHVNPVIQIISQFVSQRGYQLDKFVSIDDSRVSIEDMKYRIGYPIKDDTSVNKFAACLTSVFNIEESDLRKGIKMRYKRVANFSEMDSIEAMIIKARKQNMENEDIVQKIIDEFRKEQEDAIEILQQFDELAERKQVRVKEPGFPVMITRNPEENNMDIVISDINGMDYVNHVTCFIDSLARITQDIGSTSVAKSRIKEVCKGKKVNVVMVEELVAEPVEEFNVVEEDVYRPAIDDDFMDFMLEGEEDEDEEDDEGSEDIESEEQSGGAKEEKDENVPDVTGMSLTHPNPFFKRMRERDPALFLTRKEGIYNAYSKLCQWVQKRQPVILTQQEKDKIDKEHPGSYDKAIKYGSEEGKQFYYICPRYWSLSRNTSLTEEEVKSGKYGKVIEDNEATTVPPGQDIFEFNHVDDEGNYQPFYPGFMGPNSHPDGLCLPCCFKRWDAPRQVKLRQECSAQFAKDKKAKSDKKGAEPDNYLMGPDKFPLDNGRWGMLVPVLKIFLDYNNRSCIVNPSNPVLKRNTECLVRQGVEPSRTQSFVAVIANAFSQFYKSKKKNASIIPSIDEMKQIIIASLTLSRFMQSQNGNLVDTFYDPKRRVNLERYREDELYQNLVKSREDKNGMFLFQKTVNAFEGFVAFLEDSYEVIDYTYLWDIICEPNPMLFPKGLNLVIMSVPERDITGDIELICPSNHYVRKPFDIKKESLIIYKAGNYYEPLYVVKDTGKSGVYNITKFFLLGESGNKATLLEPIRKLLVATRNVLPNMCQPLPSLPEIYTFKTNVPAQQAVRHLRDHKQTVVKQILNYSGQTIGLLVKVANVLPDKPLYVPVEPSSVVSQPGLTIPTILIDDVSNYYSYSVTKKALQTLHKITKGKLPILPKMRLVENGLTVGILTETNQLVMLDKPEIVDDPEIKPIDETMSVADDVVSQTSNDVDKSREEIVAKVDSESYFYDLFRNTVRVLLGEYQNRKTRESIETVIGTPYFTYVQKLKKVVQELKALAEKEFVWVSSLEPETEVEATSCVELSRSDCGKAPSCALKRGSCLTKLPKQNFITNSDNENQYFYRMADELIRYSRIRSYIFEPQAFLSFGRIDYNLGEDEIIINQSMLTPEYLSSLEPLPDNSFASNNTFQTADPIDSVKYSNVFEGELEVKDDSIYTAKQEVLPRIWGKYFPFFPSGAKEILFVPTTSASTFDIMLMIIRNQRADYGEVSLSDIKDILTTQYEELFANQSRIQELWKEEGKREFVELLEQGISVSSIIALQGYYATPIDLLLLAYHFEIPIVFYASIFLRLNGKELLKTTESGSYVFIKIPTPYPNALPDYRLIVGNNGISIPVTALSEEGQKQMKDLKPFDLNKKEPKLTIKRGKNRKLTAEKK